MPPTINPNVRMTMSHVCSDIAKCPAQTLLPAITTLHEVRSDHMTFKVYNGSEVQIMKGLWRFSTIMFLTCIT